MFYVQFKPILCGVPELGFDSGLWLKGRKKQKTPRHLLSTLFFFNLQNNLFYILFFKRFYLFFRERGREGEREVEKHQCMRETWIDHLSHIPNQGEDQQPRHMPWLGIKQATFGFTDWHWSHRAASARSNLFLIETENGFENWAMKYQAMLIPVM